MTNTIVVSLAILASTGAITTLCLYAGYWNCVDRIALALHRAAVRGRKRQVRQAAQLEREWMQSWQRGLADSGSILVAGGD